MKKICRWACRHRAGLLALAVGFAAWGLFYIARALYFLRTTFVKQ